MNLSSKVAETGQISISTVEKKAGKETLLLLEIKKAALQAGKNFRYPKQLINNRLQSPRKADFVTVLALFPLYVNQWGGGGANLSRNSF